MQGASEKIANSLKLAGIRYSLGPGSVSPLGPFVQSQRLDIYHKYAQQLIRDGHAYKCYCSTERLERVREISKKTGKVGYDKHCSALSAEELLAVSENPFTIRFRIPRVKNVVVNDKVHGALSFSTRLLEDIVIVKSDGYPTYHLASVVDDHLMNISHVMRGDEWIPSSPIHALLYQAFSWPVPEFAHLPLLINKDGSKLSKRHGDVHFDTLIEKGYLPEALVNFVALLGWSPPSKKEIYSLEELVKDVYRVLSSFRWRELANLQVLSHTIG